MKVEVNIRVLGNRSNPDVFVDIRPSNYIEIGGKYVKIDTSEYKYFGEDEEGDVYISEVRIAKKIKERIRETDRDIDEIVKEVVKELEEELKDIVNKVQEIKVKEYYFELLI